jgi:hypothetical protein
MVAIGRSPATQRLFPENESNEVFLSHGVLFDISWEAECWKDPTTRQPGRRKGGVGADGDDQGCSLLGFPHSLLSRLASVALRNVSPEGCATRRSCALSACGFLG